jgi:hypothetical protein
MLAERKDIPKCAKKKKKKKELKPGNTENIMGSG